MTMGKNTTNEITQDFLNGVESAILEQREELWQTNVEIDTTLPLFSEQTESPHVPYSKVPSAVKDNVISIAKTLYQASVDRLMLIDEPLSGKTFLCEQLSHHIQEVVHQAKIIPPEEKVAVFYADIMSQPQTQNSEIEFMNSLSKTIGEFDGEAIFYTTNVETAALLDQYAPGSKVIFELSLEDLPKYQSYHFNKKYKNFLSDFSLEYNKSDVTQCLNTYWLDHFNSHYSVTVSKNFIRRFVDYMYKNAYNGNKGTSGIEPGVIPMGIWVNQVSEALSEASFNTQKYKRKDGINQAELIRWSFKQNKDQFVVPQFELGDVRIISGRTEISQREFFDRMGVDDTLLARSVKAELQKKKEKPAIKYSKMSTLSSRLKEQVIGQDHVVEQITPSIKRAVAGLNDENRPIASMLFLGPTGVGKTKMAQVLAKELSAEPMNLIRLDMSEYNEKHESSKLFGAPAGYTGYDEGGHLTEAVLKNPNSIILLDEVEEGHPSIYSTFLQVLDAGIMTNNRGETVDFTNTIIVMTSNLGASDTIESSAGFGMRKASFEEKNALREKNAMKAVKKFFRPEMINRIDEMAVFNELSEDILADIVKLKVSELQQRVEKVYGNKILADIDDNVIQEIIKLSQADEFGARGINRTIENKLGTPLADFLLSDEFTDENIEVQVVYENNEFVLVKKPI